MKKIILFLVLGIFMFSLVSANMNMGEQKNNYDSANQQKIQELKQHQYKFQNNYNFSCMGECQYGEKNNQVELRVRTQKRFIFWNVNSEDTYILDSEGKIIQSRHNFWSRLLNTERLK